MQPSEWIDEFFASYYRHRPVNATFIGNHDFDDRLPNYTANGVADATGDMWRLLDSLDAVDRSEASSVELIDLRLAEGFLRIQLWEFGSSHFHQGNPSLYVGEAVFGPMAHFLREARPLPERLDHARARLEKVPAFLDIARDNVRNAPALWVEKAMDECLGGIKFCRDGVPRYLDDHGVEHPKLVETAKRAAVAFSAYRDHLESMAGEGAGPGSYSCGEDALNLLIERGHVLSISAQEISDLGHEHLESASRELELGASTFGATDWRAALGELGDEHPAVSGYLATYQQIWEESREFAIRNDLVTWPDYPIRFVERPRWARTASPHLYFLFYRAPPAFDIVDPVDYLVEPLPDGDPISVLRANNNETIKMNHVVHHGGIGHHVQNWHAYRAASRIGQVAAVDCVSRIAMLCGGTMAEGWSCYTTDLMSDFGFCTPLESYAQHQSRLRMAARAVADVGLHTGRLTIDAVVDLYRDQAGMSASAARAEAIKNSMNPAAALMYLVGTLQIHDLRQEMIDDAGGNALRAFHDRFLSFGSIPVSIIADEMRGTANAGS